MNKIITYAKSNILKISGTIASTAVMLAYSFAAKAATLDSDVQDVASTTQNYLKGQFSAALIYIIPAVLALFVLFWVFKFVKRKMSGAAH